MTITSAVITNQIIVQENKTGGAPGSARTGQIYYVDTQTIAQGTGLNQVNEFWDDQRTIVVASNVVADPVTAPTLGASGSGGTLTNIPYFVSYSYYNAAGLGVSETRQSPQATITPTAGQTITVTAPALPAGATGVRIYVTTVSGNTPQFIATAASNVATFNAFPVASAVLPQPFNSTSFTSDVLNLSGGLTDDFGDTFNVLAIKSVLIKNLSATEWIVVGGNTAGTPNTFWFSRIGTGSLFEAIPPGGVLHRTSYNAGGWPVVQLINDKFVINSAGNGVNTATYAIVLGIVR